MYQKCENEHLQFIISCRRLIILIFSCLWQNIYRMSTNEIVFTQYLDLGDYKHNIMFLAKGCTTSGFCLRTPHILITCYSLNL